MHKLLIVDDEKTVRDRLYNIDWEQFGISPVGFAEHGLIALKKIYEDPPDILITDIHMPVMNGIDLIKQVHERYPWILIIVLTGYDDFNYIRECMRNSVFDYILKPVNQVELEESLNRLIKSMDAKYFEKSKYETFEQQRQTLIRALRKRFLNEYFNGNTDEKEIEESSAYAEINIDVDALYTVVYKLDLDDDPVKVYGKEDFDLIVFALDNILSEYTEKNDMGYAWVNPMNGECIILFCEKREEKCSMEKAECLKDTIYCIASLLNTTVSCAIGVEIDKKTEICSSIESARKKLSENYSKDSCILCTEYPEKIIRNEEHSKNTEKELVIEDTTPLKLITRTALDYIDKNFSKTITLEDVAEYVYLSPTYVSYLFRTEVKMNFLSYLTMKRIEKAKEMLRNPRNKIYEISSAVGYENARYFSSTFKKNTGQTPVEFRSSIGLTE